MILKSFMNVFRISYIVFSMFNTLNHVYRKHIFLVRTTKYKDFSQAWDSTPELPRQGFFHCLGKKVYLGSKPKLLRKNSLAII